MFAATVINFLLFSLNTGSQIAVFILAIRQALILDTDYPDPLRKKLALVSKNDALQKLYIAIDWSGNIPVRNQYQAVTGGSAFKFNNAQRR